jgi:hypothetical protein
MTSYEFVLWFKGFAQAASDYTLTPTQWDIVKDQLDKVDNISTKWTRTTLDASNWNTTTTTADGRNDITYKQDELSTNTVF